MNIKLWSTLAAFILLSTMSGSLFAGNFIAGNCTWGVDQVKGGVPWQGNAYEWCKTAASKAVVDNNQSIGSIVVYPSYNSTYGKNGHVGIVTGKDEMRSMNDLAGLNKWTNGRKISGFPKKAAPANPSCYIHYKENLK